MSICTNFVNQAECAIALNNEYNVKLISLFLLLILSVYLWYMSKKIDSNESYYHFFLYLITAYMPIIYILSSPLFALILLYNITIEMFIGILAGIYLIAFVLGFGLLLLFSKKKIYNLISKENVDEMREMRKYKNNG